MKPLTTENIWGGVLTRVVESPLIPQRVEFGIPVIKNGIETFEKVTNIPESTIVTREYTILRPILFEKTKRGLAKDSLFSCQKYPVYSKDGKNDSELIIRRSSNLGDLLLLLEYGKNMPREQAFEFLGKLSGIAFKERIYSLCGLSKSEDDSCYVYDESKAVLGINIAETISLMARVRNKTRNILPVIDEPDFDQIKIRK